MNCYSVQQVADILQTSEPDDGEFSKDHLSLLIQVTTMKALSQSERGDSKNQRQGWKKGRACAPQPRDRGDAGVINEGWTRNTVAPNVDLSFSENDNRPVNIPGHITEESTSVDLLSLFIRDPRPPFPWNSIWNFK